MKRTAIRISLSTLIAGLVSLLPVAGAAALTLPAPIMAQSAQQQVCAGIGITGGNCSGSNGALQVNNALALAINLISLIVGVAAIIMIILAGLKFITSGGDTTKVASAKNSVIYALVGLVVVAFAQLIVHFIISKAS